MHTERSESRPCLVWITFLVNGKHILAWVCRRVFPSLPDFCEESGCIRRNYGLSVFLVVLLMFCQGQSRLLSPLDSLILCIMQISNFPIFQYFIEAKKILVHKFHSTGVVWKTVSKKIWLFMCVPLPLAKIIMLHFHMMLDVVILQERKVVAALRSWLAKTRPLSCPQGCKFYSHTSSWVCSQASWVFVFQT